MRKKRTAKIKLFGKHGKGKFALISIEDLGVVSKYRWLMTPQGYVVASFVDKNKKRRTISMSRLILEKQLKRGLVVDHKNHDPLDNRRKNIRVCTVWQNCTNRISSSKHGYKGVFDHGIEYKNRWGAYVKSRGKMHHFGYYKTIEEAALAYNIGARALFGKFAYINKIN